VITDELAIREAVRDTLARYNHAGDRGRLDELAAQFTPDGILEIHGGDRLEGRAAIVARLGGVVRRSDDGAAASGLPPILRHHVSSVLIHDITADRAQSDSYFAVLTRDGLDHWGRYRDVLVPCEGRWLLASRRVRTDGYAQDSKYAADSPDGA
jgi:SnoaL-like domain